MRYEVDPREFLDRTRRMLHARGVGTGHVDADAIAAILAEVAPIELVRGTRYRVKTLGGKPVARHVHGIGTDRETGARRPVALDVIDVPEPEFVTVEGRYLGRGPEGTPFARMLLFHIDAMELAALADMDVLSIEELPPRAEAH